MSRKQSVQNALCTEVELQGRVSLTFTFFVCPKNMIRIFQMIYDWKTIEIVLIFHVERLFEFQKV